MEHKEIKGNLLDMFDNGDFDMIAHGCNCFSSMPAGIAKQIADRYPEVKKEDLEDPRLPIVRLGDFTFSRVEEDKIVFNLYTQYKLGRNLDYEALTLCFRKLNMAMSMLDKEEQEKVSLGLPKIGCGIAGGNWERVRKIIQTELTNFKQVTVVIYDN